MLSIAYRYVSMARIKSSPLATGGKAPDFTLPDQDGNDVSLSGLLARGPVVVYFYPKAFTSVCTAEACGFRDVHDEFDEAGASVVGISRDSVETQKSFHSTQNLNHAVLSDADGAVHAAFGVRSGGAGRVGSMMNDRLTFVIDRDGVVRDHFGGLLTAAPHVKRSLKLVRSLAAA